MNRSDYNKINTLISNDATNVLHDIIYLKKLLKKSTQFYKKDLGFRNVRILKTCDKKSLVAL